MANIGTFKKSGATAHFHSRHYRQNVASWSASPQDQFRGAGCVSQTLNAPTDPCQISLRATARTALTHGLVNGFGWQGAAAPLAPCCNGAAQSFFPWAFRPFLARQETPVCPVLHYVAALRVQRCKPLPQTSHRGRE